MGSDFQMGSSQRVKFLLILGQHMSVSSKTSVLAPSSRHALLLFRLRQQ